MKWNNHSRDVPEGTHSFLSPSNYHWINYSDDKLVDIFKKRLAVERGTQLHKLACQCIRMKQKLPKSQKTLNMYVNDAIGFGLTPEQPLYFSPNCFGTADAIGFRKNILRVHDLKTGEIPASLHQLEIYAALFCLEYDVKPGSLDGCELRIYQNDDILIGNPEADDILPIMDRIMKFDQLIERCKEEEYGY